MKLKVTFKDPDACEVAIENFVKRSIGDLDGFDNEEKEAVFEKRLESTREKTRKWFEFGEYVTIEIDLETGDARVVPVR